MVYHFDCESVYIFIWGLFNDALASSER